jgi:hypothetical protein
MKSTADFEEAGGDQLNHIVVGREGQQSGFAAEWFA